MSLEEFNRPPKMNRPYDTVAPGRENWRISKARHHEWHVTVEGDPLKWRGFCASNGLKALWIELNNFELQLMCEAAFDPSEVIKQAGWKIVRVKHEVETFQIDITTHDALQTQYLPEHIDNADYYEVHFKLNGPFIPGIPHTSRDLFRDNRWYITHRQVTAFNPDDVMGDLFRSSSDAFAMLDDFEYEACVYDTNPALDKGWV